MPRLLSCAVCSALLLAGLCAPTVTATSEGHELDDSSSRTADEQQWEWQDDERRSSSPSRRLMDDDTKSKVLLHGSKALGVASVILSAVAGVYLRVRCPALESPTFIGYVNVGSGAMFIAMALFHILPETLDPGHMPESMKTLMTKSPSFLPCMVLVFFGFVMVLFFERVLLDAHGHAHSHGESHEQAPKTAASALATPPDAKPDEMRTVSTRASAEPPHWRAGSQEAPAPEVEMAAQVPELEVEMAAQEPVSGSSVAALHVAGAGDLERADGAGKEVHCHQEPHDHPGSHNTGKGAIMIMASLSVHSVFEGVVIGTAKTCLNVWLFVFIVVAHKWAAAMAIANQLTPQQRQTWVGCIILGIFSLTTPVGAVLGWVVGTAAQEATNSDGAKIVECVLNSVGVGTLLYIGMVEVVPEEFAGSRRVKRKFGILLAAVALVLVLSWMHAQWGECHHGHCHHGPGHHGHSHQDPCQGHKGCSHGLDHGGGPNPCKGHMSCSHAIPKFTVPVPDTDVPDTDVPNMCGPCRPGPDICKPCLPGTNKQLKA
mmetsp:Transcript_53137/g.161435  ORF Transcript_53137/g.161435 Transcript_53137/m.161435 type:complete len:544 (-) Transcript_53137:283-1914(-)